jgi:hypothetical protein
MAHTQVPALKDYIIQLTEPNRLQYGRTYLDYYTLLVQSLQTWSSDDGKGQALTAGARDSESDFLTTRFDALLDAIRSEGDMRMGYYQSTVDTGLLQKFT